MIQKAYLGKHAVVPLPYQARIQRRNAVALAAAATALGVAIAATPGAAFAATEVVVDDANQIQISNSDHKKGSDKATTFNQAGVYSSESNMSSATTAEFDDAGQHHAEQAAWHYHEVVKENGYIIVEKDNDTAQMRLYGDWVIRRYDNDAHTQCYYTYQLYKSADGVISEIDEIEMTDGLITKKIKVTGDIILDTKGGVRAEVESGNVIDITNAKFVGFDGTGSLYAKTSDKTTGNGIAIAADDAGKLTIKVADGSSSTVDRGGAGNAIDISSASTVSFDGKGTLNVDAGTGDAIAIHPVASGIVTIDMAADSDATVKHVSSGKEVLNGDVIGIEGAKTVILSGTGKLHVESTNGNGIVISSANDIEVKTAEGAAFTLDVDANGTNRDVRAMSVISTGGTATVNLLNGTADINAVNTNAAATGQHATGLFVESYGDASVTTGPSTASAPTDKAIFTATSSTSDNGKAAGLYVHTTNDGANATVTFNEVTQLEATGKEFARGAMINAAGAATVSNNSKLTANAFADGGSAEALYINGQTADVDFNLAAELTAKGTKSAHGAVINAVGSADVSVGENASLTVNTGYTAADGKTTTESTGVYVGAASADIDFIGATSITANGIQEGYGLSVLTAGSTDIDSSSDLTINATSSDGVAVGIYNKAADVDVTVGETTNVTATGKTKAHALNIDASGDVNVTTGLGTLAPSAVDASPVTPIADAYFTAVSEDGVASAMYIDSDADVQVDFDEDTALKAQGNTYARGLRIIADGTVDVSNSAKLIVNASSLGDSDGIGINAGQDVKDEETGVVTKAAVVDLNANTVISASGTTNADGIHVISLGSAEISNSAPLAVQADSENTAAGILVDAKGSAEIHNDSLTVFDVNAHNASDEVKTNAKGISVVSDGDASMEVTKGLVVNVNNQVPTGGFVNEKAGSKEATGIELISKENNATFDAKDASTVNVTVLGYENAYGVRLVAKEGTDKDDDAIFTVEKNANVKINAYSTDISASSKTSNDYTLGGRSIGIDVHASDDAQVNVLTSGNLEVTTGVVGAIKGLKNTEGAEADGVVNGVWTPAAGNKTTPSFQENLAYAYGNGWGDSTSKTLGIHIESLYDNALLVVSDLNRDTKEDKKAWQDHSTLTVSGAANKAAGIIIETPNTGGNAEMDVDFGGVVRVNESGATTLGTELKADDHALLYADSADIKYNLGAGTHLAQGIVLESNQWYAKASITNGSVVSIDVQAIEGDVRNFNYHVIEADGIIVKSDEAYKSSDESGHNAELKVQNSKLNIKMGSLDGFSVASEISNGINVYSNGYDALVNFDKVIGDINLVAKDQINVIDVDAGESDHAYNKDGNKAEVIIQDSELDIDVNTSIISEKDTDSIDIIDVGGHEVDDAALVVLGDVVVEIDAQGRDIEAIEVEAKDDASVIVDGSKYIDQNGQFVDVGDEHKGIGVLIDADLHATDIAAGIEVNSYEAEGGNAVVVINDAVVHINEEGAYNDEKHQLDLNEGIGIVVDSENGNAGMFMKDADLYLEIDATDKADVIQISGDENGGLFADNAEFHIDVEAGDVEEGISVTGDNATVIANYTDFDIEVEDQDSSKWWGFPGANNGTTGIEVVASEGDAKAIFTDTNMDIEVANDTEVKGIDVDASKDATLVIDDKDHKTFSDPDKIFIDAEGAGSAAGVVVDADKGEAKVVIDADIVDIDVRNDNVAGIDTPANQGVGIDVDAAKDASVEIDANITINVVAKDADAGITVNSETGSASVKGDHSDIDIKVIDTETPGGFFGWFANESEGIAVHGAQNASAVFTETNADIFVANEKGATGVDVQADGKKAPVKNYSGLPGAPGAPEAPAEVLNGNAEFVITNSGKNGVFDIDAVSENGVGIDVNGENDAKVVVAIANTDIDVNNGIKDGKPVAANSGTGINVDANHGKASVEFYGTDADINVTAKDANAGIEVSSEENTASVTGKNSEISINVVDTETPGGFWGWMANTSEGIDVDGQQGASVDFSNTELEIKVANQKGATDIDVDSKQGKASVMFVDNTLNSKLDLGVLSDNAANIDVDGALGASVIISGVNEVDLNAGNGKFFDIADTASGITATTKSGDAFVTINDVDKLNVNVAGDYIDGVITAEVAYEYTGLVGPMSAPGNAGVSINDVDMMTINVLGGEVEDLISAKTDGYQSMSTVAVQDVNGFINAVGSDIENVFEADAIGGAGKIIVNNSNIGGIVTDYDSKDADANSTDVFEIDADAYAGVLIKDSNVSFEVNNAHGAKGIDVDADNGIAKVEIKDVAKGAQESVSFDLNGQKARGIDADGKFGADIVIDGVDVAIEGNAGTVWGMDIPGTKASGITADSTEGNASVKVNDAKVVIDLDGQYVEGAIVADAKGNANVVLTDVAVNVDVDGGNVDDVVTARSNTANAMLYGDHVTGSIDVFAGDVENALYAQGVTAEVLTNKTVLDIDLVDANVTAGKNNRTNAVEVYGSIAGMAALTDTTLDIDVTNVAGASGILVNSGKASTLTIQDLDNKKADEIDIRVNGQDVSGIKVVADEFASARIDKTKIDIDADGGNFGKFEMPATVAAGILVDTVEDDKLPILKLGNSLETKKGVDGAASLAINNADVDINLNARQVEVGIGVAGKDASMFATNSDIDIVENDKNRLAPNQQYSVSAGVVVAGQSAHDVVLDLLDTDLKVEADNQQFAVGVAVGNAGTGAAVVDVHGKDDKKSRVDIDADGELAAIGVIAGSLGGDAFVQFDETFATVDADGDIAAIGVASVGKDGDIKVDDGSKVFVNAISSGIVKDAELDKLGIGSYAKVVEGVTGIKVQDLLGVSVGVLDVAYGQGETASFTIDEQSTVAVNADGRSIAAGVAVAGYSGADVTVDEQSKLFVNAESDGHTLGVLEGVWDGTANLDVNDKSALAVNAKGNGIVYGIAEEVNTAQSTFGFMKPAQAVDIDVTEDSLLKVNAESAFGQANAIDVQVGLQGLASELGIPETAVNMMGLAPTSKVVVAGDVDITVDDSTVIATAKANSKAKGVDVDINGYGNVDVDVVNDAHVYASGETFDLFFEMLNNDKAAGIEIHPDMGSIDVNVAKGSTVKASAKSETAEAISLEAEGMISSLNVDVTKGSSVEANAIGIFGSIGIDADAAFVDIDVSKGSSVKATADGGWNAAGIDLDAGFADIDVNKNSSVIAEAKYAFNAAGVDIDVYDIDINVENDSKFLGKAEAVWNADGINISSQTDVDVVVDKDSDFIGTAKGGQDAFGIEIDAGNDIDIDVTGKSDFIGDGKGGRDAWGIGINANDDAYIDVAGKSDFIGDGKGGRDAWGIEIDAGEDDVEDNNNVNIKVVGNSDFKGYAKGGQDTWGIDIEADNNVEIKVAGKSDFIGDGKGGEDAWGIDIEAGDNADIKVAGKSDFIGYANGGEDTWGIEIDAGEDDVEDYDNVNIKVIGNSDFKGYAKGGQDAWGIDIDADDDVDIKVAGKSDFKGYADGGEDAWGIKIDTKYDDIDIKVVRNSEFEGFAKGGQNAWGIDIEADDDVDIKVAGKSDFKGYADAGLVATGIEINSVDDDIDIKVVRNSEFEGFAKGGQNAWGIDIEADDEVDIKVAGKSDFKGYADGGENAWGIEIDSVYDDIDIKVVRNSEFEGFAKGVENAKGIDVDADDEVDIKVAGKSDFKGYADAGLDATGIEIDADDEHDEDPDNVNIKVVRNSEFEGFAKGGDDALGIDIYADDNVNIKVAGQSDFKGFADGKGFAYGIDIDAANTVDAEVIGASEMIGTAKAGKDGLGIGINSDNASAYIDAKLGSEITGTVNADRNGIGIDVRVKEDADFDVENGSKVTGTANVGWDGKGINVLALDDADIDVEAFSSFSGTANAGHDAIGIDIEAKDGAVGGVVLAAVQNPNVDIDVTGGSTMTGKAVATNPVIGNDAVGIDIDGVTVGMDAAYASSISGTAEAKHDAEGIDINAFGKVDVNAVFGSSIEGLANAGNDAEGFDIRTEGLVDIDETFGSKIIGTANAGDDAKGVDIDAGAADIDASGFSKFAGTGNAGNDAYGIDIDVDKAAVNVDVIGGSTFDGVANAYAPITGNEATAIEIDAATDVDVNVLYGSEIGGTALGTNMARGIDFGGNTVDLTVAYGSDLNAKAHGKVTEGVDLRGVASADFDVLAGSDAAVEVKGITNAAGINVIASAGKATADIYSSTATINGDTVEGEKNNGLHVESTTGSYINIVDSTANVTLTDEKGNTREGGIRAKATAENAKADIDVTNSTVNVKITDKAGSGPAVGILASADVANIDVDESNVDVTVDLDGDETRAYGVMSFGGKDAIISIDDSDKVNVNVSAADVAYGIVSETKEGKSDQNASIKIINVKDLNSTVEGSDAQAITSNVNGSGYAGTYVNGSTVTAKATGKQFGVGVDAWSANGMAIVNVVNSSTINVEATATGIQTKDGLVGEAYGVNAESLGQAGDNKVGASLYVTDNSKIDATVVGATLADGVTAVSLREGSAVKSGTSNLYISDSTVIVNADSDKGQAYAIGSYSEDDTAYAGAFRSKIESEADGDSYAIAIEAWGAKDATLNIENAVDTVKANATSKSADAYGVAAVSDAKSSDLSIKNSTVTTNVEAGETARGVVSYAKDKDKYVPEGKQDTANLTIDNSTVEANANGDKARGVAASAYNGTATVTVTKSTVDATATGKDDAVALNAYSKTNGDAAVDIKDSTVTAEASSENAAAYGLGSWAFAGNNRMSIVDSSTVEATASGKKAAGIDVGYNVRSEGGNTVDAGLLIKGSTVTAIADATEGTGFGITLEADYKGLIAIDSANVTASGTSDKGRAAGIIANVGNGGIHIDNLSTVNASGEGAQSASGLRVGNGFAEKDGNLYVHAHGSVVNATGNGDKAEGIAVNAGTEFDAASAEIEITGTWYNAGAVGKSLAGGMVAVAEEATIALTSADGTASATADGNAVGMVAHASEKGEINIIGNDSPDETPYMHHNIAEATSANGNADGMAVDATNGGVHVDQLAHVTAKASAQNGFANGILVDNEGASEGGDLYMHAHGSSVEAYANGNIASGINVNLGPDKDAENAEILVTETWLTTRADAVETAVGMGANGNNASVTLINSQVVSIGDPTLQESQAVGIAATGDASAKVDVQGGNTYAEGLAWTYAAGVLADAQTGDASIKFSKDARFDVVSRSNYVALGTVVNSGAGDATIEVQHSTGTIRTYGDDMTIAAVASTGAADKQAFIDVFDHAILADGQGEQGLVFGGIHAGRHGVISTSGSEDIDNYRDSRINDRYDISYTEKENIHRQ